MENKGTFFRYLAVAAIIIVIGVVLTRRNKTSEVYNKQSGIIDEAKTEAKKIAQSVDEKGYVKATFERKDDIIGNGDISKLPVSQSVLDSMRLDNLDKTKKLERASYLTATLEAKALRATKTLDSLNRVHYEYVDDYAKVGFTPDSMGGKFDFNYKIKLVTQDYTKRKNIFNPRIGYTDILSPDKRITIDGLQTITIKSPKPSRVGFGLQAGYYFDPAKGKFTPAIGAGISYNLIQL